jgi:hypothetical protein
LQQAFEPFIQAYTADPERALAIAQMIQATPALDARRVDKQREWHELLVPEVARRLGIGDGELDPRPRALVGSAIACLDAACDVWVRSAGRVTLPVAVDRAMRAVPG